MENVSDGNPTEMNAFIDWIYGKENDPTYGAVARFVQDHVSRRPAAGGESRWNSFTDLRRGQTYFRRVSSVELDTAITAFRAAST